MLEKICFLQDFTIKPIQRCSLYNQIFLVTSTPKGLASKDVVTALVVGGI